jgi:hypothetical protein
MDVDFTKNKLPIDHPERLQTHDVKVAHFSHSNWQGFYMVDICWVWNFENMQQGH